MSAETRVLPEGTRKIEIGVFCDSSNGHVKGLELSRRPVLINTKHIPLPDQQNIQELKERVQEHLTSSPGCNPGTISYVGSVGSSPVNFRI